jgi:hypothetical protein
VPPAQAPALAALPIVSAVRLPRSGEPRLAADGQFDEAALLARSGLARLRALPSRGKGLRVAVIDGDFRGWQALAGKGLPKGTRLIDLTAARNPDLRPDKEPAGGNAPGHGTHIALAAARAVPEAEMVLLRIDPAAPYEFLTALRAINGDAPRSINIERRSADLDLERLALDERRQQLLKEREAVLNLFPDLRQKDALLQKKKKGALSSDEQEMLDHIERYEAYQKGQAQLDRDVREHEARVGRLVRLEEDLLGLRKVRVVVSGLSWEDGLPVDGGGPLARYLEDRPFRANWYPAAGDPRGQAWVGLFRDRGGDGVLEFRPPGAPLPANLWGPGLAFLGWREAGGAVAPDLPAKARLRVTVQWREPHDPEFLRRGEDAYREPLAALRLLVLRQLDPSGKRQPADDFEVVAQSTGLPQRLDNQPNSAVYEQEVEFTVPEEGRYALRVEGQVPPGIRPRSAPSLPAQEIRWELRPRVFVQTLDGAGRAVLRDFATAEGSVGTPGDALRHHAASTEHR